MKKALDTRSRSRSRLREGVNELVLPTLMPPPHVPLPDVPIAGVGLGLAVPQGGEKSTSADLFKGIVVTKTTRVTRVEVDGQEEMTVDELGVLKQNKENVSPNTSSRRGAVAPAISSLKPEQEDNLRAPSPDITTILSSTPRPSLSKSLNAKFSKSSESLSKSMSSSSVPARPRVRSVGIVRKRINGASSSNDNHNSKRRASDGPMAYHKAAQSTELAYLQQQRRTVYGDGEFGAAGEDEHDEALERALDGEGSDDGHVVEGKDGEDSDSSLDLHTPLP